MTGARSGRRGRREFNPEFIVGEKGPQTMTFSLDPEFTPVETVKPGECLNRCGHPEHAGRCLGLMMVNGQGARQCSCEVPA